MEPSDLSPFQGMSSSQVWFTPEGGVAVKLVNDTGAPSVKGTLLSESDAVDLGCKLAPAATKSCIGIMYESGIADGALCWVVIYGLADILLKDTTAAVRGNWVVTSDVAGRADATATDPPGSLLQDHELHFAEVAHCMQSKTAGTDVLARCMVHFN